MSKKISIVSPCYNESDNVENCYETVRDIFESDLPGYQYEHIFSDNASTDATPDILHQIAKNDQRVKVIFNARNYGPFRSTFNAVKSATGDAVLVMLPVDLQDPPELIPDFVREWEAGAKIVYGQRQNRSESLLMKTIRRAFYRTIRKFADIDIPNDTAEFQLIDAEVHKALITSDDHYPYIRGLIANTGFADSKVKVPYTWRVRRKGLSKNRLYHLIDQAMNGLISFTVVPLRLATLTGFAMALLSLLYGFVQLLILLFWDVATPPGVATLIVAIFFFSGVQLFFIGVLGEYVASIHQQVRRGSGLIERGRLNFDVGVASDGTSQTA